MVNYRYRTGQRGARTVPSRHPTAPWRSRRTFAHGPRCCVWL